MGKKDFNKGMEAGAKPFEEKYRQLSKETKKIGENVDRKLNKLGEVIDVVLDDLSDIQKKDLYDLNTPFDLKEDLDSDEKEILAALLLALSNNVENNEYQQKFIRSVNCYIGIVSPQMGLDISCIENIENINAQKIIMQTAMEYLFLETEDFSFIEDWEESLFDYFSVNKKGVKEIQGYIQAIYQAVGRAGIAEKYGFVLEEEKKAEEQEEEEFPAYDGSDICEACADAVNIHHHYAVLDDYLVFCEDDRWEGSKLCYVAKKTGKKAEIDLKEKYGMEYIKPTDICGAGKTVFIMENWEKGGVYQLNIDSLKLEKIDSPNVDEIDSSDTVFCCNDKYLLYRLKRDEYRTKSKMVCINYLNRKRKEIQCEEWITGVVLFDDSIIYNEGGTLKKYDIDSENITEITPDLEPYDFLKDQCYYNSTVSLYKNYLFQANSNSYGGYLEPTTYTMLDLKNPTKVTKISIPRAYSVGCFVGYEYIYCIEDDSSLNRYNVITGEMENLTKVPQCMSSYTEGVFKKKTVYSVDIQNSQPQVIGNWLYYADSTNYMLANGIRQKNVYKVALNVDNQNAVVLIQGTKL